MRRTIYRNGKSEKTLYRRVTEQERIRRIEYKSENWLRCESKRHGYRILIQRDVRNHWTDCYKIRKSDLRFVSLVAGFVDSDWMYYERSDSKR